MSNDSLADITTHVPISQEVIDAPVIQNNDAYMEKLKAKSKYQAFTEELFVEWEEHIKSNSFEEKLKRELQRALLIPKKYMGE